MTTIAIIGAGRGLGAATARRFGAEGFDVALVSRNLDRARGLAADLVAEGVSAHGFATDARDPAALARTLERITETVGPIEVLQYSPLPQKDFLRPVLETTAADLVGPVETSIYGPVAAVHQVLPGMRFLGRGTVLFVNGGSGARPSSRVAGTSIAFAGLGAFATMLHDEVAADGVHVAQLIIPGAIEPGHPRKDPAVLGGTLWSMHTGRDEFRVFAESLDA
ncbi:SDR family NAD(P)-dependent oxidoreductase [Actinomycetospora soli]|uniref:SDR family NAD(P)-dependent oxidoreductase n=1 Tax=Actinomycetospora soli TaxID=2893887 RepID=UPI001E61F466|nr:SDR family NAD(P)-dependent oxidoreductase [Actinomycetospora soli]MCD2189041.1 SDR family NAD(P)-dependent oxidoreductase [Actinomycetospora soli]